MQKNLWVAGCRLKNNVFLSLNESLLDIYYTSFKNPSFFGRKVICYFLIVLIDQVHNDFDYRIFFFCSAFSN